MSFFTQAQQWLDILASEAQFFRKNKKPNTIVVRKILKTLSCPDKSYKYRVIVGGTAGKGTICRLCEDVLLREGKTVCTLMSPHIQVMTERIRINGQLIHSEFFGEQILKIKAIAQKHRLMPTYYEAIIVAGILAGKEAGCDILIAEIGLGGTHDAVNVVQGERIAALTFIGDDHREILGPTLVDIAREKAGIFNEDSVLNLSFEKNLKTELNKVAFKDIQFLKGLPQKLPKKMTRKICEKILEHGNFKMQKAQVPCRWEKIKVKNTIFPIILDGAHSAPRFEFIRNKIKKLPTPRIGIMGMASNHDPHSFNIILDLFDTIYWVEAVIPERSFWSTKALIRITGQGQPLESLSQKKILALAKQGTVIITGSFFLCGVGRSFFYNSKQMLRQQTEYPK